MTLLGIRFCHVAEREAAEKLADVLGDGLGLVALNLGAFASGPEFAGAVFPAADGHSWAEIWPAGEGMPPGTMLQLVVDDADAYAEKARDAGLAPVGPTDTHGERIYHLALPGGGAVSFQSRQTG